ncbi:MAG: iron dicitrate transport regulator FecR [Variovorax paradoxus]|nr:MAG: iron dicitrate transport regulator FecR [Variovorax paradoxus]PZQ04637.1 MAG: iron dicitrate transport regulator FecR [Variovorax paradoxus]
MDDLNAAPPAPPPAAPAAAAAQSFDTALLAERDALRVLFPLPPARSRPAPAQRLRTAGLTGLVLALSTALLLWWNPAWRVERHATAIGEHRSIALADGSQITLDTASAVRVAWHLRSREAALLQGRARFDVAHDRLRAFTVDAGSARVRVLGTVFDVQRRQGEVRVSVLRGLVQVQGSGQPAQPWLLHPGERLRIVGATPAQPEPVAPGDAEGAWVQGRLVFDRTPLRDALAEVQRYRSAPIRLYDDGRLGRQTLSGVFDTAQTDRLLDLLPEILNAKVQRQADGSVQISR